MYHKYIHIQYFISSSYLNSHVLSTLHDEHFETDEKTSDELMNLLFYNTTHQLVRW